MTTLLDSLTVVQKCLAKVTRKEERNKGMKEGGKEGDREGGKEGGKKMRQYSICNDLREFIKQI